MRSCFALKDNKIVCKIDVAPFSIESMDKLCREMGFDGWFELDKDGALIILGLEDSQSGSKD